jgi:putative ABC transport system permease protein
MNDFKFALRQLSKNAGFTTVAVLTLALGIGAASAVFGLIQGVLLSPPPYARPDRLVLISSARADGENYRSGSTIGDWIEWRKATTTLQALALYRWTFNFLVLPDGSESLEGMVVTSDYFDVMGLRPMMGRSFVPSDGIARTNGSTAIILGNELWQRRFAGDREIVGKTVRISRISSPLTVVGVMPAGVRFLPDPSTASEPNYDLNARVDFWFCAAPDETRTKDDGWNVVGRLRAAVDLPAAQAEITTMAARQVQTDPDRQGLVAKVQFLQQELNREGRHLLVPLLGAVAFVFLIACANVSGLLLARGLRRQQEYAVRASLGAGQVRLFRQALAESLVLAVVGSVAGAVLAAEVVQLLKAIGGHAVPRLDSVTVGWPVFAFGFCAALIAAVVAGLLPAVRASRQAPFHALRRAQSSAGRSDRRLLASVATLQTALTLGLLVGAALLIRTMISLGNVRTGYDTDNILAMTVTTMQNERWKEFHTQVLERVSGLPGVRQAAFGWGVPLTGNKWNGDMEIVGEAASSKIKDRMSLPLRSVTPDYFDAFGIKILDGRGFQVTDNSDARRVAIVNEALVARYFPGHNPLGSRLHFLGSTNEIEVVGIVANTRTEALSQTPEPEIYFPFWQSGAFSKHLIVRTSSDPRALISHIRSEIHAVDPTAAVEHIKTMADIRNESVAPRTFAMRLLIAFSVVASVLALIGIYGVLSLSVDSRTKEIAVRAAIGAQRHEILGLILGEGARLIFLGLLIGAGLAVLVGRLLSAFLFGVHSVDALTLVGVALLFAAVALLACWLPAWQATRIDPMEALRDE